MRFLLLDRIEEIKVSHSIEGIKCWTLNDEIFEDHFPGMPIVPGVLLLESMAQLLGVLIEKSYPLTYPNQKGIHPILSIISKAKLREPVIPGDQCILKGELKTIDEKRATGRAQVFVDGKLKAESDLIFVVLEDSDFPENKFFHKRQEYISNLTRNTRVS